jgi:ATP-binding cassette subfamily B protein
MGVVLFWEATQLVLGFATFGDLAMLFHICRRGQFVFDMLLGSGTHLIRSSFLVSDLFDLIDTAPGQDAHTDPPVIGDVSRLELCNVGFRYPGQAQHCLSDLNMKFDVGEIAVVLGRNGSGKSTLVKLLAGLYETQSGTISLFPHGPACCDLLRREVGVVFQPPLRFEGRMRDGIVLEGCVPQATDSSVANALERASCQDFVCTLTNADLTHLGTTLDKGAELSGGQWQRLALARALHRDTSVLVLDEPTSALDPWHDADWLDTLRKNATNKVVIIVTHKLALAAKADSIYVLDGGRVVQNGNHRQLLGQKGPYQSAWRGAFGDLPWTQDLAVSQLVLNQETGEKKESNIELKIDSNKGPDKESNKENLEDVLGVVPDGNGFGQHSCS